MRVTPFGGRAIRPPGPGIRSSAESQACPLCEKKPVGGVWLAAAGASVAFNTELGSVSWPGSWA